jgi:hypothetical protein
MKVKLCAAAALILSLAGCSGLTQSQQRVGTATVGGTAIGAVLGAIGGNAGLGAVAGAGAGLVGGLIYDRVKNNEQSAYDHGYNAGSRHQAPSNNY